MMRATTAALALALAASAAHAGESPIAFFAHQERASSIAPFSHRPLAGNSDVIAEFRRHLGQGNFTGHPGAWCAFALSYVLTRTGHKPLASGLAYSALSYGPHLAFPRPGALIVLRGHVGLVAAVRGSSVSMISGNWGRRVRLAEIPTSRALAFIAIPEH